MQKGYLVMAKDSANKERAFFKLCLFYKWQRKINFVWNLFCFLFFVFCFFGLLCLYVVNHQWQMVWPATMVAATLQRGDSGRHQRTKAQSLVFSNFEFELIELVRCIAFSVLSCLIYMLIQNVVSLRKILLSCLYMVFLDPQGLLYLFSEAKKPPFSNSSIWNQEIFLFDQYKNRKVGRFSQY